MMMKLANVALVAWIAVAVGCSPAEVATTPESDPATAATGSDYLATSEPAGAVGVGEARQQSENDEAVTLVGVVGGRTQPFVDGLAAFTIVDPKVPYCAPDEGCATPWDYCCETEAVKDNIATVKVVDAEGKPVATDARELLNVKELSTVVVEGTAQRDEQGNLSVLAKKVFVRPAG